MILYIQMEGFLISLKRRQERKRDMDKLKKADKTKGERNERKENDKKGGDARKG